MEKKYLATYLDGSVWNFAWFNDEKEAQDWIDNDASSCSHVEVVELVVTRILYQNGFRIV